jgi:hypothetical protein
METCAPRVSLLDPGVFPFLLSLVVGVEAPPSHQEVVARLGLGFWVIRMGQRCVRLEGARGRRWPGGAPPRGAGNRRAGLEGARYQRRMGRRQAVER